MATWYRNPYPVLRIKLFIPTSFPSQVSFNPKQVSGCAMAQPFECSSYLSVQIELLKFAGFWPIVQTDGLKERLNNFLSHLHMYILFVNLIHMAISQIISISIKWNGSIMEISPHLLETIVALTVMGFQLTFFINQEEFKELFHRIDTQMRPRSIPGVTFVDMERPFRLARKFSIFWMCLSVGATAHYSLNPILDGERRLPVPVVYNFDVMQSPYFEVEYSLQFLAQLQYGFAFSIIIGMVSSVSIMLCGQLDVLYCGIHNLLYAAMIRRGDGQSLATVNHLQRDWKWTNKDKIRYYYSRECFEELPADDAAPVVMSSELQLKYREYDGEVVEVLKELIRHHQFIIGTARGIEKSFRQIFFLELFEHTAYTCIITYALTMHEGFDNLFIHMVYYFFMVNLDTFLMCYTPHLLAEQVRDFLGEEKESS